MRGNSRAGGASLTFPQVKQEIDAQFLADFLLLPRRRSQTAEKKAVKSFVSVVCSV